MRPKITGCTLKRKNSRFYDLEFETERTARVPRVTSVLGVKNKPALIPWAGKEQKKRDLWAVGEAYDIAIGARGRTCNISRNKFVELTDKWIGEKKAYEKVSKVATDLGTQAHDWIRWEIMGELGYSGDALGAEPKVDPKADNSCIRFMEWRAKIDWRPIAVEFPVYFYDETDDAGYAGTVDAIGDVPTANPDVRQLLVLDWKTGKAIYEESWMQMAAYLNALNNMFPDEMPPALGKHAMTGSVGFAKPVNGAIVRLPKGENDPDAETYYLKDDHRHLDGFFAFLDGFEYVEWVSNQNA
jgi:hypothetical protein